MLYEIIFYGRGGQGGVTAANLLVYAAMYKGLHAQGFPFFGAERRGAPVTAFARVSDKPILRHGMFDSADILLVLDWRLSKLGILKNITIRDGGLVIINAPRDYNIVLSDYRLTGHALFYRVDATKIAVDNGLIVAGWPVVNTGMLGAFAKATNIVDLDHVTKAIKTYFKGKISEINAKAAETAYRQTELIKEV
ncbi:MAG: pyruvate ferredoxin oxidoreductase [Thermoprotei archaeon]|nr:MAG: pyruvate ferredoxin oxidoreductase [Thermoprotei archaeon]